MVDSYISARTLLAKTWKSFTGNMMLLLTIPLIWHALKLEFDYIIEKISFLAQNNGTGIVDQELLNIIAEGGWFGFVLLYLSIFFMLVLFFICLILGWIHQYKLSLAVARGLVPTMSIFDSMAYAVTYFCKIFLDDTRLLRIFIGILVGLIVGVVACVMPLILVLKQVEQLFYCNIFSKCIVLFLIIISCLCVIYMMIRAWFFMTRLIDKKESSIKESLCYSWKITQGRVGTIIRISFVTVVISSLLFFLFAFVSLLLLHILFCGNGLMVSDCILFLLEDVWVVFGILFSSHLYIALTENK